MPWVVAGRWVDTELDRPRLRFTLNRRIVPMLQAGVEVNPVVEEIGPLATWFLLTETDEIAAINYVERIRRACDLWLESGAIAMRLEDYDRAEDAFARALDRHEESWYAELELAIVAALAGRRDEALTRLDRADELNPLEETVDIVRDGVVGGEPVSPHVIDRIFLQRVEERTS